MKLVALLPVKNEEKYLPSFLSTATKCCDEIVAIDDGSIDRSVEILEEAGASVYVNGADFDVKQKDISSKLLELGREHSGSHFAFMDADEAFTGQLSNYIDKVCSNIEPGNKVKMRWLALWKSVDHYRDDGSWSEIYKDFIIHDDGETDFGNKHESGRTPGSTTESNSFTLNPKYGSVVCFQYSDWDYFKLKQAWRKCKSLLEDGLSPDVINKKYAAVDEADVVVSSLPSSWTAGLSLPTVRYKHHFDDWCVEDIKQWFRTYGIDKFSSLDIWNIPEVRGLL